MYTALEFSPYGFTHLYKTLKTVCKLKSHRVPYRTQSIHSIALHPLPSHTHIYISSSQPAQPEPPQDIRSFGHSHSTQAGEMT